MIIVAAILIYYPNIQQEEAEVLAMLKIFSLTLTMNTKLSLQTKKNTWGTLLQPMARMYAILQQEETEVLAMLKKGGSNCLIFNVSGQNLAVSRRQ